MRKELRDEDFSAECRSTDAVDVNVTINICIRVPTETSNWVGSQGREDGMVRIEKTPLGQGMERDEWREKKEKSLFVCARRQDSRRIKFGARFQLSRYLEQEIRVLIKM